MLKKISLLALIFSLEAGAAGMELTCVGTHNSDQVLATQVTLEPSASNQLIGESEQFRFYLSSKGNDVVELQSFDKSGPSRSYASAKLTEENSFVELAVWKREFLLEVRCTR